MGLYSYYENTKGVFCPIWVSVLCEFSVLYKREAEADCVKLIWMFLLLCIIHLKGSLDGNDPNIPNFFVLEFSWKLSHPKPSKYYIRSPHCYLLSVITGGYSNPQKHAHWPKGSLFSTTKTHKKVGIENLGQGTCWLLNHVTFLSVYMCLRML